MPRVLKSSIESDQREKQVLPLEIHELYYLHEGKVTACETGRCWATDGGELTAISWTSVVPQKGACRERFIDFTKNFV